MNLSSQIKKSFQRACVYFSLITAVYALISWVINVEDGVVMLDAARVLLFFLASLLFALGNFFLKLEKMNGGVRIIIHYLLFLLAFYSCFMLPIAPEASTALIGVILFTLGYAVVMLLCSVIGSRYKRRRELASEYKSQYKK